ncbi:MAG: UDP-3-O-(3-hydroxymyristoyl)glucosamine N-acyltransferase [Acidobacteria bacterium]|nr:UDP-3-O-(3-hydroxymyristoyl)glucosamine N-acyltransferase [Acidobacteriota bacterium]
MKAFEIAEFVGGAVSGNSQLEITSFAALNAAKDGDISFLERAENFSGTNASCVMVPAGFDTTKVPSAITVKDPKLAFARIAQKLRVHKNLSGIHETAVVPPDDESGTHIRANFIGAQVSIGKGTYIGEGAVIHDGVRIGNNVTIKKFTVIHPNCVIYNDVEIGYDCVIHAGTVIGADGFGYVRDENGVYHQFPQVGTVVIEDNVEIGANSCIDRGALGETRIGEGTKIDNLVQVGHNVNIGKHCVIAAQTGISGSVTIEDGCVIGGQVGFGDHVTVQSGAVIGSQAGILPGKIVRPGVWWGTPIQPLDEYKRQNAHVKSLERMKADLKEIKRKLD